MTRTENLFREPGHPTAAPEGFTFTINNVRFDEDYEPSSTTRATTNFANLARGENRRENLRQALRMIDRRCNALAHWDNPDNDRYRVQVDIVSAELDVDGCGDTFPAIEVLKPTILDHNRGRTGFSVPEDFGELHGNLFRCFVNSSAYRARFAKPPVICLSVSHDKTYRRTANQHPVLGTEYMAGDTSLTERYFRKMGLRVRYFMPAGSVAPFAFFFFGDLLNDYTNLELIGTISMMETFQKIYRPEIYNANSMAGEYFRPSLQHQDYSLTRVVYDREERNRLAVEQGRFAESHFIRPHRTMLSEWSARYAH